MFSWSFGVGEGSKDCEILKKKPETSSGVFYGDPTEKASAAADFSLWCSAKI